MQQFTLYGQLKKLDMRQSLINNPETVSTDFSISDKLYFEPLTIEDVMHIIDLEKPEGVIVQFGGQTAINLAAKLEAHGVKILGTSLEDLDRAEDRDKFEAALTQLGIPQPVGKTATTVEQAVAIADKIGYPVLVRPSYVLGGRAMEIVYRQEELLHYMKNAVKVHADHPVLIDRYMVGKEIEVDAISDGEMYSFQVLWNILNVLEFTLVTQSEYIHHKAYLTKLKRTNY